MNKYEQFKLDSYNYQNAYCLVGNFSKPVSPFSAPLTEEDTQAMSNNIACFFEYLANNATKVSKHLTKTGYFTFEHGMFHEVYQYETFKPASGRFYL